MGAIIRLFSLGLIILGIVFSALFVLNGDIIFHTDIARDFVLLQDIVVDKHFTLIGPKIGPVPGIFHGPLWLYLNAPLFWLGQGNPVVVGWGWVGMGIIFLLSVYLVMLRIFNRPAAILAALFFASRLAFYSHQLFNPSGAVFLTPLFFYLLWAYFRYGKPKFIFWLSIVAGSLIQFEIAAGLPLTLLASLAILVRSLLSRKLFHPFYLLGILIPLSTYLLFDLRHGFFQLNSALDYLKSSQQSGISLWQSYESHKEFLSRSSYLHFAAPNIGKYVWVYLYSLIGIILAGIFLQKKNRLPYLLYLYLFAGYWTLALFYHGVIETYYYEALQTMTVLIVASSLSIPKFPKLIPLLVLLPTIYFNFLHSKVASYATYDYSGNHASSWQYNLNLAKELYLDAGTDFGYFVLSEDLLAYSPKYAIMYAQNLFPNRKSFIFEKKPITYVIISKDTYKQGSIDVRWWEEGQVRIAKKPVKTWEYRGNYIIKRYELTPEEVAIPEDPNLVQGLQFR